MTTTTGAARIGDADELEVVTRHPELRALRHVSLSEAMSTAHFMLRQVQDVLH
jgi:hypothetical protein